MRLLVLLAVACGSTSARVEPPPIKPSEAVVTHTPRKPTSGPRAKRPFTLEVFEIDASQADRALAQRFTDELHDMAGKHTHVTLVPERRRPVLLDHEVMSNCQRTAPNCLATLARSVRAERIIFGDLAGQVANVKLYVVATDTTVEWSTDRLPSDNGALSTVAHDAIRSLFFRAP